MTSARHWIEKIEQYSVNTFLAHVCCRDTSHTTKVYLDLLHESLISQSAHPEGVTCEACGCKVELFIVAITPKDGRPAVSWDRAMRS